MPFSFKLCAPTGIHDNIATAVAMVTMDFFMVFLALIVLFVTVFFSSELFLPNLKMYKSLQKSVQKYDYFHNHATL